jgi:quinol-cytochrome oxidoreductase complex cytochrome b subunit
MNPQGKQTDKFYPYYLFEILIVIIITLELIIVLAVIFPPSLDREIDLTRAYHPRPEWYFLALYQLVRYFPGNLTFIGAIVIPGAIVIILFLLPFLDRSPETSLKKRPFSAVLAFGLLASFIGLTLLAIL